ncbi:MAG TPA: hypothetical protein P5077_06410 [bacterium]|nr:hypothetical protein [bacterium]
MAMRKPIETPKKENKRNLDAWQKGVKETRITKTIRVKEALWKKLKVTCAERGETLSAFFERLAIKELGE